MREPFTYDPIFYNEAIYYLEQKWGRALTDHEKHIVVEAYCFGRTVEADNEIKIIWAK